MYPFDAVTVIVNVIVNGQRWVRYVPQKFILIMHRQV